jgi:hypothetical protein
VKRCRHECTATKYDCDGLPDPLELSYLECLDCGDWLPLGESNDSPPEVQIEIALAACIGDTCILWEPGRDRDELIERYIEGFSSQGGTP